MTLALLLPQFAPNLYDLSAMLGSDRIILQDTDRWSRKSRVHRAQIRTPQGTQWIHIPLRTADRKKAINKVRIDHDREWVNPLLRALRLNYRNSIYYDLYEPEIQADFRAATEFTYLLPFILHIQQRLLQFMEIRVDYTLASELDDYSSNPDVLAQRLGADVLWQEHNARRYQRQGETAQLPNISHPTYHHHFEGFEAECCILDVLFQFGPESFRIIDKLNHQLKAATDYPSTSK